MRMALSFIPITLFLMLIYGSSEKEVALVPLIGLVAMILATALVAWKASPRTAGAIGAF